ncbi:hypothetical protein Ancab_040114 [Ancistrocladus abbreviatus]
MTTYKGLIADIDKKEEAGNLSSGDVHSRKEALSKLDDLMQLNESMMRQRSCAIWLREGDANTKFFHCCVNARRRQNGISHLLVHEQVCSSVEEIRAAAGAFYANLYREEAWVRPKLVGLEFKRIQPAENNFLCAEFSDEEIRESVWSCHSEKSPGPDGFSFAFIKECWDFLQADFIRFVQDFHKRGRFLRGTNASFITLIPKTQNPIRLEEFRPISLVGCLYKIIAKLLANRLKKIIDKVVSDHQTAFIGGRQILDGVVTMNEIVDEVKKKCRKSFMFKVDFEKAYDRLNWQFLLDVMEHMGFNGQWRGWIAECLRSSSVSVLVNGCPTPEFSMERGLCQGDPLSPFLFILAAEGMSAMISRAESVGLLIGCRVGNGDLRISHLQYADDTVILGKATEENIKAVKCILRGMELVSGLKVNYHKSSLIGFGCDEIWVSMMAEFLLCKVVKGFKFFGFNLGVKPRSKKAWEPVLQLIQRKLGFWQSKLLSFAGRVTMLNAVLSCLPIYKMGAFLAPKGVIKAIDKSRRCFLWGASEAQHKISWVKWTRVCKPRKNEGLGVKDLEIMNRALLGKWRWQILSERKNIWQSVLHDKYGDLELASNSVAPDRGSRWWRDLWKIEAVQGHEGWFSQALIRSVGDGVTTKFWVDRWLNHSSLADEFPNLFAATADQSISVADSGYWYEEQWTWSLVWSRGLNEDEVRQQDVLMHRIQQCKIKRGSSDRWSWLLAKKGTYSVQRVYSKLDSNSAYGEEFHFQQIWGKDIPAKVSLFFWRGLHYGLPTKTQLLRRGIIRDEQQLFCGICLNHRENLSHILIGCDRSWELWMMVHKWWGFSTVLPNTFENLLQQIILGVNTIFGGRFWKVTCLTTAFHIWKGRNCFQFARTLISLNKMLDDIQIASFFWLTARFNCNSCRIHSWIANPREMETEMLA